MSGIKKLLEVIKLTAAGEVSEWLAQFWLLLTDVESPMALVALFQESRLDHSMRSLILEAIGGEEVYALLYTYFLDLDESAIDKLIALFTQLSSIIGVKCHADIVDVQQVVVDRFKMFFPTFFTDKTWTTAIAPWTSLPDGTHKSYFLIHPIEGKYLVAKLFINAVFKQATSDSSAVARFRVSGLVFYPSASKHQQNLIQAAVERGFKQLNMIQRASRQIRLRRESTSNTS